jgi:hypothetical protein
MVLDKCDEFVRACLAKWLLRKHVTDAAERVRALLRHVLLARAKVESSKKFRIQSKFLLASIAAKHCVSQVRVRLGSVAVVPEISSCTCGLPITICISVKKTIW